MSFDNCIKHLFPPINREGYPFVIAFACLTLFSSPFSAFFAMFFFLLAVCCFYFFRDPPRIVPKAKGAVVSPADGTIVYAGVDKPPEEIVGDSNCEEMFRVSIFLSTFDVHVNRMPFDAYVAGSKYVPGRFINASMDKASEHNERKILHLKDDLGRDFYISQVAGLIARRIVCYAAVGDDRKQGERFGMIRFGSRVDLYMPNSYSLIVAKGQTVVAGETLLAVDPKVFSDFWNHEYKYEVI